MQNNEGRLFVMDKTSKNRDSKDEKEQPKGRLRLRTANRRQLVLRSVNVDELIAQDHEARAIWDFVLLLDKSTFYEDIQSYECAAGSPAIDPQILLSVWTYSYAKGISSAREISRLCEYDPAFQWLTGMTVINYHTLADFRGKYPEALENLFMQILGVLTMEELVTLEQVVHDGSKVIAHASGDTFRREDRLRAHLEMAREHLAKMGDPLQSEEVGARIAKAQARAAKERVGKLELALEEMEKIRTTKKSEEEKKDVRVSETDPESRVMKHGGGGGYRPSYNVQISTDCANGIIVGAGVSQSAADFHELIPAVERIEKTLGKPEKMAADGGFTTRENALAMEKKGIDFYGSMDDGEAISAGQMKRRGVDEGFLPNQFCYDAQSNRYTCPAGKMLKYEGKESKIGVTSYHYRASVKDCQSCPNKSQCCPKSTKGRMITRNQEDPRITAYREKMKTQEAKKIYGLRGPKAEFSNAWLKEKIRLRQFRLVGFAKVQIELLWACIAYDISQWIRLRWRPRLAGA